MLKRLRGVSGSPVFVVLPPAPTKRHENKSGVYITLQANTEFYLLGVMITHFGLNDPKDMRELVNLGVAVIIDASYIWKGIDMAIKDGELKPNT